MGKLNNLLFRTEYTNSRKLSNWTTTIILLGLALITRIILFFAAKNSLLVENLYSSSIYPYIAKGVGFFSSIIPLSIAEVFLALGVLFIITVFFTLIVKPRFFVRNFKSIFHFIIRLLAIVYVLFYFSWGFNYFRLDYSQIANFTDQSATYDELLELTSKVIQKSNAIRDNLLEDKNGVFLVEENFNNLGRIAKKGFDNYYVGNLHLGGNYGRVKPVFLSKYMSYTGIMGIFIPFTSEPTINVDIPYQNLLSTISHEIAHQRGFAKEDEANFIAYKANINNPDERFQYSGYYLAMTYLMNEVYKENKDDYFLLYDELSDGVKRDMEFSKKYWASKEGQIEKAVNTMNDNYLKLNNQVDGVRSYSGVVKLLLAEYKDQNKN